ncbi:hypothetical protein HPB51_004679 [Rhipicephalus microplus]|uniref:Cytochrome P450 n=1 Tax=Rhipicephalus microplus TaxID=6941 RepID=A0A9J6EXJ7_RHIMP|nr:hypothetical protein HPB51_004679 [Rhipicephalus microplus]
MRSRSGYRVANLEKTARDIAFLVLSGSHNCQIRRAESTLPAATMLHAILLVLLSIVFLIVGSYQGLIPSLVVADPDVLREICVKDFKSFVNKSMVPKMTKTMDRFTKLLLAKLNTRQPANLCQLLEKSAMDLYTSLIFDLDIDSHVDTEHPMLKCYSGFLSAPGGWRLLMMTTLPRLFKAFRVEFPNKGDSQYALDFTKHLIERRLRANEDEATYETLTVNGTSRRCGQRNAEDVLTDVSVPAGAQGFDQHLHVSSIRSGSSSCIGMRMGMVQVKYILYRLLQNVTFEPCAETQVPLSFAKGKVLLEPDPPIQLKIVPRARCQSSGSSNNPTAQG